MSFLDDVSAETRWALRGKLSLIGADLGDGASVIAGLDPLTALVEYRQSGAGGGKLQIVICDQNVDDKLTAP